MAILRSTSFLPTQGEKELKGSRGNHGTRPEQETQAPGQKLSGASAVTAVPQHTKLSLYFPKHVLAIILALWGWVSHPSYSGFPAVLLARERALLTVHLICYWLQVICSFFWGFLKISLLQDTII